MFTPTARSYNGDLYELVVSPDNTGSCTGCGFHAPGCIWGSPQGAEAAGFQCEVWNDETGLKMYGLWIKRKAKDWVDPNPL